MKNTWTQEELQKMVTECTDQVESLVKSEVANLQKWEHEKSMSASSSASESSSRDTEAQKKEGSASASSSRDTEAQKAEGSAAKSGVSVPKTTDAANGGLKKGADDPAGDAGSSDALPSEGAADSAPASAAPSADAAPAADPAAAAPGAEQPPTLPELTEAYCQLSPPELDMHKQAIAAAEAQMSAGAGAAPAGAPMAPPASPSAGPAPDAAAAPAPMPGAASQPVAPEFAKSEADVKIASLEKSLEATVQIVATLLGKPNFKSVTGEDTVTKTEKSFDGLTKGEVTDRLNKAVSKGLSKGDSLLLKSFYKGEVGVNDIGHLLAVK